MNSSPTCSNAENPFDKIADEFVNRIRNGEHPSLDEYRQAYPNLINEIDELFPTLAELENYDPIGPSMDANRNSAFESPQKLGDYIIKREIGRGGMGIVYEAEHETMRRRVALKVLPFDKSNSNYQKRFLREARAAGQLHHTNIVPVFEVGESDGVSFYAMQYIHGQNLDVVIEELKGFERPDKKMTRANRSPSTIDSQSAIALSLLSGRSAQLKGQIDDEKTISTSANSDRPTPVKEPPTKVDLTTPDIGTQRPSAANKNGTNNDSSSHWTQIGESGENYYRRVARVGLQIADALQYAHEHGVLHRDIKPSNLILDTDGIVWITDFGLAKDGKDDLTHTGDIVGTLRYMAPERFKGDADARSEVYSVGLTLYELCTLQHAFDQSDRAQLIQQITTREPPSPRRIRPGIPRDLETVIAKSIAREPSHRYQSAQQMAADLRRFIADRPVQARRVSSIEQAFR